MAGTDNLALEVMLKIVHLSIYVFQILNFSQMYDVSNFQFLTAVPVNSGETWCGADYIQSNCVLVWSKVLDLLIFHQGLVVQNLYRMFGEQEGVFLFFISSIQGCISLGKPHCPFSIFEQKSDDRLAIVCIL